MRKLICLMAVTAVSGGADMARECLARPARTLASVAACDPHDASDPLIRMHYRGPRNLEIHQGLDGQHVWEMSLFKRDKGVSTPGGLWNRAVTVTACVPATGILTTQASINDCDSEWVYELRRDGELQKQIILSQETVNLARNCP